MNKRVIAAAAAGVLALLGVLILVKWAQDANDRAFEGAELVSVVRLTANVDKGTTASDLASATKVVDLPKESVPDGAVTDLSQVSGRATNASLQKGEVLLKSRMVAPGQATKSTDGVPKGYQQVTISLDAERSVGGTVKAGDRVGIIATAEFKDVEGQGTNVLLDDVLVTKVDKTLEADDGGAVTATMVTLAVKALDAQRIIHAQKWGVIWLTLQNADTDTSGSKFIDGSDVL